MSPDIHFAYLSIRNQHWYWVVLFARAAAKRIQSKMCLIVGHLHIIWPRIWREWRQLAQQPEQVGKIAYNQILVQQLHFLEY